MTTTNDLDVDAIREKWATQCGPCDAGLPMGCTCPKGDPRVPISALLTEVSDVTAERDLSYDLLDGTAKVLGLDLDNYHVHNEVPAKAAELVVERDQFRESARYYSALAGEQTAELEKLRAELARARADERNTIAADIENMPINLGDTGWKHLETKADEASYPAEWVRRRRTRDDFTTATIEVAYQYGYRQAAKVARGEVAR